MVVKWLWELRLLKGFADGKVFGDHCEGSNSLVVFLHGWARTKEDFSEVISGLRSLESSPTMLSLDLPGFGSSPEPDHPCGTDWYGDVVAQVVAEYIEAKSELTSVYLVGHSFGGRVAMQVAGRGLLESLRGVLLTGVPLVRLSEPAPPPWSYRIVRVLAQKGLLPASVLESARKRRGSSDYLRSSGVMREVFVRTVNEDYRELLRSYCGDLTLVWGELDAAVPVEVARRICEHSCGTTTLEIVPGTGHLLPTERPTALVDTVSAMVGGVRS